ncbi:hypothetical protein AX17_004329 [Amanita inopinata Kibby_2008]|nr:hypothetical protein AX17_004329 [Amanita inopinata Kibby_2008]
MTPHSRNSSEEGSPSKVTSNVVPPRPFFLAENKNDTERSRLLSSDASGDPPSDSDREQQPPHPPPARRTSGHQSRPSAVQESDRHHTVTTTSRPPPSSFLFPFQAYPGNPDPGMPIPGVRSSSRHRGSIDDGNGSTMTPYQDLPHSGSLTNLSRPYAPFMASSTSIYKSSAAANISSTPSAAILNHTGESGSQIPRTSSTQTFRSPFLSPASRPSSLWSPPTYPVHPYSPSASSSALPYVLPRTKPPLPSTRIAAPLSITEKPWMNDKEPRATLSYWITVCCMLLGLAGAAFLCWHGVSDVQKLNPSKLCMVLDEDFDGTSLDESVWSRDVELGGFGNGEFEMTTTSSDNLFLRNSQLYIHPTLSSDTIQNILDGGNYTLEGCSTKNRTACTASSNAARGTVINPVMSARINTKGKKSIKYGKVEIKAKMPRGDWLWPAIWMLPEEEKYGKWPSSGEIDILESRGNRPSYPAQGSNFVRSSVNYGPLPSLLDQKYGWYSLKRSSFDKEFHVYGFEWDEEFMRFYTDSRIDAMLNLRITSKNSFWHRGRFPGTAQNGSAKVAVTNPWADSGPSAPFDQPFYLIVDLAVGGTSGWFPDNKGGKPWYDGSLTAMRDFAKAQDNWASTWPESEEDRSLRIEYIKMWEICP